MSKGGWEYATGALAVHDSATVTVVVSLGAGGPGIGRRAARAPRTKNRGIRRARDDARRGAPPRAARTGRYRANQREMPRRPPRKLDSGFHSGFALQPAHAAQIARIHWRRDFHPRAWHWRNDRNIQCCRFSLAATTSLSKFPSGRQDLEHVLTQGNDRTHGVGAGIP